MNSTKNTTQLKNFDQLIELTQNCYSLHKFSESKSMLKHGFNEGKALNPEGARSYLGQVKKVSNTKSHTLFYQYVGVAKGLLDSEFCKEGLIILGELGVLKSPSMISYVGKKIFDKASKDVLRDENGYSKCSSSYFGELADILKSYRK